MIKSIIFFVFIIFLLCISCSSDNSSNQNECQISKTMIKNAYDKSLELDNRSHIILAAGWKENFEKITNPVQTEVYTFIAVGYDSQGPSSGSWVLGFDHEWKINSIDEPLELRLDINLIDVYMDVCDAWKLISKKIDTESFYIWELFQRLHPDIVNPFFAFTIDGGFVIIDSVTKEIHFE